MTCCGLSGLNARNALSPPADASHAVTGLPRVAITLPGPEDWSETYLLGNQEAPAQNMADSQWIIDVTTETFETEVIERSMTTPVVVDFWAPWCGPCKQLAPMLEQICEQSNGRFVLAKINVDENQDLAAAFRVQSIPLVVAISEGRPVNQFQGVLPEDQLVEWLSTFMPSPADDAFREGAAVEEADPAAAVEHYRNAVELDAQRPDFQIALARALLALDQEQECREIIDRLEQRGFLEPEAERLKSQLEVRADVEESGGVQEARKLVDANPNDLSHRLTLAEALAVDRKFDEACEICLDVIMQDRDGVGADAKETMVKILDMLGPSSELAGQYRRRLATAFY